MTVPAEVVAAWATAAENPVARQRQHHDANEHGQPFGEDCWHCGRNRAKCRSKVWYDSIDAAQAACDMNHPLRDRLVLPYRCFWSEGLHWHVKTAKWNSDKSKARKRMARFYARRLSTTAR